MIEQKAKTTPKDFFLYILSMITLYWSAVSVLTIIFQLINSWIPDTLDRYAYQSYGSQLRFGIASLIITFPVYFSSLWYLVADVALHPEKRTLWVRRWLIYFTLFAAALIIIGDSIALLNTFLGGEIKMRFMLKSVSIMVVAGLIFGYYAADIRKSENRPSREMRYLGIGVVLFVVGIVLAGLLTIGSPERQRKERFDEQRVNDLMSLQSQIITYWQGKNTLPNDLAMLGDPLLGFTVPIDPETSTQYSYSVRDSTSFELCAVFNRESGKESTAIMSRPKAPYPMGMSEQSWVHGSGKFCFNRTIDKDFFPKKIPIKE